jgi:hypothetical protein
MQFRTFPATFTSLTYLLFRAMKIEVSFVQAKTLM